MSRTERKLNKLQQDQLESRRRTLLESLNHAFAPAVVVEALAAVGLNSSDLATATGAHVRTAAIWLDETDSKPKKLTHQDRLRELKEVVRFMVEDGTIAYQEADWLRAKNRSAEFRTPLELIASGEWKAAGLVYCDDVAVGVPDMFGPPSSLKQRPSQSPRPNARIR